jgi:hypothetical protein
MPLIAEATLKTEIPTWELYCQIPGTETTDEVLTRVATRADTKLIEWVPSTTETNIATHPVREHYLVIVRYYLFREKNGDEVYDPLPAVVRDYQETMKALRDYRTGVLDPPVDESAEEAAPTPVKFLSKPRRFKSWFNQEPT